MKELIVSETTGKTYDPAKAVRIVNYKQATAYIANGAELLDLYPSKSHRNNEPLLVYIFDRAATTDLYDKWCNYALTWEGK